VDSGAAVGDEGEEMIPVHFDPMGQQAMFLAWSRAQMEFDEQQAAP
jgi:hypothetical protein